MWHIATYKCVNALLCILIQLPLTVTVNYSTLAHLMPLEVVGFFVKRLGVKKGDWILVATSDSLGTVGANLVMRNATPINVVLGMTHLNNTQVYTSTSNYCL